MASFSGMNRSRRAMRPAALLLGCAVALTACKPAETAGPPPRPQPIQVMTVVPEPEAQSWSWVGVVRPRFETDVAFRVSGKLIARLADVGQRVEPGVPLARLDPTDLRLAVEAQEAELAAARSSRDQAVAAEARHRTLLAQGHVAQAALDQRVAAADEARGRLERAERNLSIARNQLAYADLTVEHAGVVTAQQAEAGQVMAAGQPVLRVARLDAVEVLVAIPEHLAERVRTGTALVEIWGGEGGRLPARLRELAPDADRVSRTYQARFAIDARGSDGLLGRTATVHLALSGIGRDAAPGPSVAAGPGAGNRTGTGPGAMVVELPLAAVMSDGRGPTVWILAASGSRVARRAVRVLSFGRERALVSGLSAGEQVVTLGVHMLDEDKPVRVVDRRTALR